MSSAVIIVAAGLGTRLGADRPKALVELAGRPLLSWATERASHTVGVERIVVVAPQGHLPEAERAARDGLAAASRESLPLVVVPGGAERHDSVANGLAEVGDVDCVLVHDAARCLAPVELFDAVVRAVESGDVAVVPGLAVADTIKRVDAEGIVVDTPPRAFLRAVQTPQGFRADVLRRAHAGDVAGVTDDAGLVERLGLPVRVVPGHADAEKVTTQADLVRAHRLLEERT
ncbi:MAG: 2-C-methyl-D-erythritol 4-phosphate cytidylyltransferase [Dermatophilus congolensis]|nr:2-C-methyl-D-erythritol 4-phosphate cytidylyltransferase [Dermatophilus congolensis]